MDKRSAVYVFPLLGRYELGIVRLFGSGLGNILFPWARAQLLARDYELTMIEPTWSNLRIGSIIRGERDFRFYSDLFKFQSGNISGVRKLATLTLGSRHRESLFLNDPSAIAKGTILVEGVGNYFETFRNEHDYLKTKLLEITKEEHKKGYFRDYDRDIAVHVRLGDFKVGAITTSIGWYKDIIQLLRNKLGADTNVYVFSDGTDEELTPLLSEKLVSRLTFGSSIADILAMSKFPLLVGSRYSTFSMWASFLGQMPTIWPIDKNQTPILESPQSELQTDGTFLSEPFLESYWDSL